MNLYLATDDDDFEARLRESLTDDTEIHRLGADDDGFTVILRVAGPGTLVALGPDIDGETQIGWARRIDESCPGASTILVTEQTPGVLTAALRAGVRDLVDPAAGPSVLRDAFGRAAEVARRQHEVTTAETSARRDQRTILVTAAKGGSGKSMFSTNLAVALAQEAPGEVVLVDLDLQFGDAEHLMRLEPEISMADVARPGVRLDGTSIAAFLTPYADNSLYVLAAPSSPAVADDIRPEIVGRALDLLIQRFRYVVIDTAAGIDENALMGLDRSTDIVLLSATDIAAVRASQKTIEALTLLGLEDRRWHFVLNRANARVGLTQTEIESALGLETAAAIPSTRAVPVSFNDGTPLVAGDPRSPVTKAITAFASTLVTTGDQSSRRRRWALSR